MENFVYELPDYNQNPDIPRELDILANAIDQQVMTNTARDDLELRFQEQLEEMRSYITTLSESNAIPTLYQMSTEVTIHKYQAQNIETVDDLETLNINDLVGTPLTQTYPDDIGEYIQVGTFTFMITGIVDIFTYSVAYSIDAYINDVVLYDKNNLRDFTMVANNGSMFPSYNELVNDISYILQEADSNTAIFALIKNSNLTTTVIKLKDIDIPLFSVFYSTFEKMFKMWDGHTFVDFGQTFIPQAETYTKDEIDAITGLNSSEISKREYLFQSGSNVFIDRADEENPVLNVLNFDALDKTKDAITSFIAKEQEDINGYQIILNTLSTAQSGGFKINLPNIINDEMQFNLEELQETINGYDEVINEIKEKLELLSEREVVLWEGSITNGDSSKIILSEGYKKFRTLRVYASGYTIDCPVNQGTMIVQGSSVGMSSGLHRSVSFLLTMSSEMEGVFTGTSIAHSASGNHGATANLTISKIEGLR